MHIRTVFSFHHKFQSEGFHPLSIKKNCYQISTVGYDDDLRNKFFKFKLIARKKPIPLPSYKRLSYYVAVKFFNSLSGAELKSMVGNKLFIKNKLKKLIFTFLNIHISYYYFLTTTILSALLLFIYFLYFIHLIFFIICYFSI